MSKRKKQIFRVGASGLLATLIDLATLLVLVEWLGVLVVAAVFIASCAGATASFLVNKFWAFRDASPLRLTQITSFAGVALGSALGVAASVHIFSVVFGASYLLAKALSAALVFVCWSYPLQARVVFSVRSEQAA